ncbi:unnamed protein product [Closterium sp. NIES-53]
MQQKRQPWEHLGNQQGGQHGQQPGDLQEIQPREQQQMQPGELWEMQPGEQQEMQPEEQHELQPGEQQELQLGEQQERQPREQQELRLGGRHLGELQGQQLGTWVGDTRGDRVIGVPGPLPVGQQDMETDLVPLSQLSGHGGEHRQDPFGPLGEWLAGKNSGQQVGEMDQRGQQLGDLETQGQGPLGDQLSRGKGRRRCGGQGQQQLINQQGHQAEGGLGQKKAQRQQGSVAQQCRDKQVQQPGGVQGQQSRTGVQNRERQGQQPGVEPGLQLGMQQERQPREHPGNQQGGQHGRQPGEQQGLQPGEQQRHQLGQQPGVQQGQRPGGSLTQGDARMVVLPDTSPLPPACVPCEFCFHTFPLGGAASRHIAACKAADAQRRAHALSSSPNLSDAMEMDPVLTRDISEEVWAAVPSWDWETFFSIHFVSDELLRRIPQRARLGVPDVLCCILKRLKASPGDEAATLMLMAFPHLILGVPVKEGVGRRAAIVERPGKFWEGQWRQLFEATTTALTPAARPLAFSLPEQDADAIHLAQCRTRCQVGEWSRGLACLTTSDSAQPSQLTVDRLKAKHPEWVEHFHIDSSRLPHLTGDALSHAIHSAARVPAPGPSGWMPEHLRDTFLSEPSYLPHLLEVFKPWILGFVSERVRPWLAASNLVGLSKPKGDVRPVAIGEVLPRILARALCILLRLDMESHFAPYNQLGVGTRSGVEILAHAFRSAIAIHPSWCALQIDVANAFNSFHRHAIFDGLRDSPFACLIPFLCIFYGVPSSLFLRTGPFVETLVSERGSRQGDPFGPFLFAFMQQLVMEPMMKDLSDLLFQSYADDTYVMGPRDRVLVAYSVLRERLEWVGLEVQSHKCKLWERGGVETSGDVPLGMQLSWTGLIVVGVPIGEEDWEAARLRERLAHMQSPLPWLPVLNHPRIASHLLAVAVSARPIFLTRTVPVRI